MYKYYTLALTALAALATATDTCDPVTETDCDADVGLSSSTYSVDFTAGADTDNWESVGGGNVSYTTSGAEFTITEDGDSPTIQTAWYIFFGRIEVHMKAAPGTGIVSCVVLLSDDLDEVDWEWLGGYPDEVQTNYFGKGVSTSSGRSTTETVDDAQDTSHNYTLYWTSSELSWYLDGSLLRTVTYDDAANGDEFPQTPSRVKIGIWAGGDSDNAAGTISWAGGETDYDDGPFTMVVESVDITNFNPASNYTYSDQTGDYTSIVFDTASESDGDSDTTTTTTSAAAGVTSTKSITPTTLATAKTPTVASAVATESSASGSDNSGSDDSSNDGSDDSSDNGSDNSGSDNSSSGDNSSDDSDCDCDSSSSGSGWQSGHHGSSSWGSWSSGWGKSSSSGGHSHGGSGGDKFKLSKFFHGHFGGHGHH